MSKTIAIIDYSLGNTYSVQQALMHLGANAVLTDDKNVIESADAIVLPGVGAFAEAMNNLNSKGLAEVIHGQIGKGKQFMGICLGLQLLFDESEEFGSAKGLGIIPGKIRKFAFSDSRVRIPQMAWNRIYQPSPGTWNGTALQGIKDGEYMYFVHSYYAAPENRAHVLCETDYEGFRYCSAVIKGNVFATQYHPEKSAAEGLKIYKNWIEKI